MKISPNMPIWSAHMTSLGNHDLVSNIGIA